jgi:hypothetical protein
MEHAAQTLDFLVPSTLGGVGHMPDVQIGSESMGAFLEMWKVPRGEANNQGLLRRTFNAASNIPESNSQPTIFVSFKTVHGPAPTFSVS